MDRAKLLLAYLDRLTELSKQFLVPEDVVKAVVNELNKELEINK